MPSSPAQGELRGNVRLLQGLPLFGELADRDLVRLCRMARRLRVPAGEFVMREGAPGDGLYVILDGELEVTKREGDRDLPLARRGPGEFVGEMSLLEQEPRSASVRALRDSELLLIPPEEFQALLRENPATASGVLKAVAARLRSTEAALVERERLASLGTLAAGLAHELNNPASAIQRSISHLREALVPLRHPAPAPELVERLRMAKPAEPPPGEEGVREDALIDWLEDLGVDRSWEIAPPLAQAGWTPEALGQELARAGSPPEAPGREPAGGARQELGPILTRLAAELTVHQLLDEMEAGSATMSEIVQAVKRYSYMDRAPVQEVDLVESLESTLVMLRHRWK